MRFRLGTLCAAIITALLFYAVVSGLVLAKISRLIDGFPGGPQPFPSELLVIFVVALTYDAWIIARALVRFRRRSRDGFCRGCGRVIYLRRPRCAHCGVRMGSTLSLHRGFPVN